MKPAEPHQDGGSGDERWMQMALGLARKGRGLCSPNPMVGAVVVSRSGRLAGSGWHKGPGRPHAEVLALGEAGAGARGATVYVNLEPCPHFGRTPPCVDALLRAQVGRVVCSMEDPDPRVAGRGIAALRAKGVEVVVGLLSDRASELNRAYVTHRSMSRPYVTFKVAASLDGKTSAADGSSQWITSAAARLDVHRARSFSDAVCVGVGTVLADDPALTPRGVRRLKPVARVVVDSLARTPPDARVLKEGAPSLIFVSRKAPVRRLRALERAGAEVITVPADTVVPIDELLKRLAEKSIMDLLLEGGPKLAASFAGRALIDRYLIYLAPKLLGAPGTGQMIEGWAAGSIDDAQPLRIASVKRLGGDLRFEAFPLAPARKPAKYGLAED